MQCSWAPGIIILDYTIYRYDIAINNCNDYYFLVCSFKKPPQIPGEDYPQKSQTEEQATRLKPYCMQQKEQNRHERESKFTPYEPAVIRYQLSWKLHSTLQNIATEQRHKKNCTVERDCDKDECPDPSSHDIGVVTSITVDWDTHLLLQSLQAADAEPSVTPEEELKSLETCDLQSLQAADAEPLVTPEEELKSLETCDLQSLQAADAEPLVTPEEELKALDTCDDGDDKKVNPHCTGSSGTHAYQPLLLPQGLADKANCKEEEHPYQQLTDWL